MVFSALSLFCHLLTCSGNAARNVGFVANQLQQSKCLALLSITWWALASKSSTRLRRLWGKVLQKLWGVPPRPVFLAQVYGREAMGVHEQHRGTRASDRIPGLSGILSDRNPAGGGGGSCRMPAVFLFFFFLFFTFFGFCPLYGESRGPGLQPQSVSQQRSLTMVMAARCDAGDAKRSLDEGDVHMKVPFMDHCFFPANRVQTCAFDNYW